MPKLSKLFCTIKNLLSNCEDSYVALFVYRSTLIECGYSQAEFLMNRQFCSTVPNPPSQLKLDIHINTLL